MLVGCGQKPINIIKMKGLKTQPSIEWLNKKFTIDKIVIFHDNRVGIFIKNISDESVSHYVIDNDIELRPIKDGKPVKVRADKTIMRADPNTGMAVDFTFNDELYPGETALIYYTMPSSITSCDDYVIFSDYYLTGNFAKLSSFVDCSNLR